MPSVGIVTVEELSGAPERFQVVDARRKAEHGAGHIPGALWIGWEDWCDSPPATAGPTLGQRGYWGVLADAPDTWYGERLAAAGLSNDKAIVVYADGPRTRGREGRVAWMLLYLGASEVRLLDGGWSGWLNAGEAVEQGDGRARAERFSVFRQPERRCSVEQLKQGRDSGAVTLVDTRSAAEYAGEIQDYLPRRGHLPDAVLVPFTTFFNREGEYVGREGYGDALPPLVRGARSIAAYCEVGVRASLFAMLHEVYTGQVVRVYDGSIMEWGLMGELPVVAENGGK